MASSPSGYDWTKDKIRVSDLLRARGNQSFKSKKYQDAIENYSQALNVLPPLPPPSEISNYITTITESLVFALVNRAFCHLKLSNYKQCIKDCSRVLHWDHLCEKALFRRAKAFEAIGECSKALIDLKRLKKTTNKPTNKPIQKLLAKVNEQMHTIESKTIPTTSTSTSITTTSNTTTTNSTTTIIQCPLDAIAENALHVVVSFLSMVEIERCSCTGKLMAVTCNSNYLWKCLYNQRWGNICNLATASVTVPFQSAVNKTDFSWKLFYKDVLFGNTALNVQVLNRETSRNLEFTMSAYDAKVTYRIELNSYHCTYLRDGRGLVCETVDRQQLRPIPKDLENKTSKYDPFQLYLDPNTKYHKQNQLSWKEGQGVEIQWKRHKDHPFGWWYGEISKIWHDTKATTGKVGDLVHIQMPGLSQSEMILMEDTNTDDNDNNNVANDKKVLTKVTVIFEQYKKESCWHQVTVVVGSKEDVRSMGGWVGGIRRSLTSKQDWNGFLPNRKIS